MSIYPEGYDPPVRPGATAHYDPTTRIGPADRSWGEATVILREQREAWLALQHERREREPKEGQHG